MRKIILFVLCTLTLLGVCACENSNVSKKETGTKETGTKETGTKETETKEGVKTIEGIVYYILDMYDINNDIEGPPDRAEIAIKLDETKDRKCTYVVYYTDNLGVIVKSDGHKIGDKVEIEYEGELENINDESGRSIEEGDWYRIINAVHR